MTGTVVATANVAAALDRRTAGEALEAVLEHVPDLVGLQEWYPARRSLLRRTRPGYRWHAPLLGGCAVGVRRERFEVLRTRAVLLSRPGSGDRRAAPWALEPGRVATVVTCRDRDTHGLVSLVDYHLVYGVQGSGVYRTDRPRLVARHRGEVEALGRLVTTRLGRGEQVFAVGDSNFHGLRLPGLTSAWEGRPGAGTLGPTRQVDDVFSPGGARDVTLIRTASDHRALIARCR